MQTGNTIVKVNKLHLKHFNFTFFLWIICVGLLIYLIVSPIGYMIYESFTGVDGAFTLEHYYNSFSNPRIVEAVYNTLIVSAGVAILSIICGVPLAFGVSRTNMPGKNMVKIAVFISIITPSFLLSMAYIVLAGPNAGYANRLLRFLFNLSTDYGPLNIYTLLGLIVLSVPGGVSYVFLQASPAFENMDPSLEESARSSGASQWQMVKDITLPLAKPAILSGALLSFSITLAMYGIPHMLNMNYLTIAIRKALLLGLDFKTTSTLSVVVVFMSITALMLYRMTIRSVKVYQTVSGKGFRPRVIQLKKGRYVFLAVGIFYSVFAFLLPYSTLILVSLFKNVGEGLKWSNLTLRNYPYALSLPLARVGFANSTWLSTCSATIVVFISIVVGYIVIRSNIRGKGLLDYLSILPLGIAGTALAAGLILIYLGPLSFIPIYATLWILMVGYVTRFIPIGMRNIQTSLMQVSSELEEVARITGANWGQTVRDITIPIIKNGILCAWILVFVRTFSELSVSILLRNVGTDVVSTAILDMWDGSERMPTAMAFGVVLFLFVTIIILIAQKITGSSITERVGGI